jgi:DNA-binding MarR family transcriptional regulator
MFEECMYFNTSALARRLEREWAVAFKPFGLAPPQAFMLRAVIKQPGALQSELADALAISRPTATRALDGLEEKRLVMRRPTGEDGRQIAIHPTDKGVALGPGLNEASARVTARLKKQLGESRFRDLVAGIRDVRSAMK